MKKISKLLSFVLFTFILFCISSSVYAADENVKNIYRLYNSTSSEHLYTPSREEVNSLVGSGSWTEEGIGWGSPTTGDPVYRIYSPDLNEHLYSTDVNEVETLCAQHNWRKDFNGNPIFNAGGSISVFRLYNPQNGRHHLTNDENEYNVLGGQGWQQEGTKLSCVTGFAPYFSPVAVADRINVMRAQYPQYMPWTNDNYYESKAAKEAGWGCHAFALLLSDAAFGNLPARKHNDANNIRVGDIIRMDSSGKPDNHSAIVLSVDGDWLTLAEGNWNHDINWDRSTNKNWMEIAYIITRYPN